VPILSIPDVEASHCLQNTVVPRLSTVEKLPAVNGVPLAVNFVAVNKADTVSAIIAMFWLSVQ
jgi:hypothetical protein